MKRVTLIIVLLVFVAVGYAQNTNPLDVKYTDAWSDDEVYELVNNLKKTTIPRKEVEILQKAIDDRPGGFTSEQTVSLLKAISSSTNMANAVMTIDKQIMGMKSKQVIDVLGVMTFSSHKLTALKVLRNTITDEENKYDILDAFTTQVDKSKAKKILDEVKQPRSFIYGSVTSKGVVFIVDLSGSMEAKFVANTGKTYSRMSFVKMELTKALKSLNESAKFNMIFFESNVSYWKSSMVSASSANVKNALQYVSRLKEGGGTNIYDALETAYKDKEVKTIYFLTDGMPTAGKKQNVNDIINDVKRWNTTRNIIIHTTAFLTGDFSGDDKPKSRSLMKKLAETGNGVYRAIE